MRSIIVDQCLAALKRDEVKTEIRSWITPLADFVLEEMQPYLYIFGVFIIVLFLLQLATFAMIIRIRKAIAMQNM